MRAPLLLGHRGTRSTRPVRENTLAAFDLALAHGCDGFEFDVRRTGDGQAVLCHDDRFAGMPISSSRVSELGLPLLNEILARYARRAFLDIELKVPGLAELVLRALSEHRPERGHVVSSFLPRVLSELNALSASAPLGLIADTRRRLSLWRELPIDYVIPHRSLLTADLVCEVHEAGKKLLVWTVNRTRSMLRLAALGVDGIISDETELLVRTLRRSAIDPR
jgi:glycerophosphoryl diester phosphodiesterase